jgi:hypothetical protein
VAAGKEREGGLLEQLHTTGDGVGDIEESCLEDLDRLGHFELAALVGVRAAVGRREKVVSVSHRARPFGPGAGEAMAPREGFGSAMSIPAIR